MVEAALARHVRQGDALCVGLSGGRDSVVLLDCLWRLAPRLGLQLSAVHVHHGISANADAWAAFCGRIARARRVPIAIERVDPSPWRARGLEAAARAARYEVYQRQAARHIVLAHHRNDQAETLLLQLVRGAGIAGLAAMPEARPLGALDLLRPLLAATRPEIENYALARRLRWIEDESNLDTVRARNAIRMQVMPVLQAINPAAIENIGRSVGHLGEALALLASVGSSDLAGLSNEEGQIEIAGLARLDAPRRANALRAWFAACGARPPTSAQLDELWAQIGSARASAQVTVALDGWVIHRFRGRVGLTRKPSAPPVLEPPLELWRGDTPWVLPTYGGIIEFDRSRGKGLAERVLVIGRVEVRPRSGQERLRLNARGRHRSLKNLFQEQRVPPWERGNLPLLFVAGTLAWVPGLGLDPAFEADPDEPGCVLGWRPLEGTSRGGRKHVLK